MKNNFLKFGCAALSLIMMIGVSGCKKEKAVLSGSGEYPGSPVILNGDEIYPVQCEDTLTYWKGINGDLGTKYANFGETPIAKQVAKETGVNIEYIHPAVGQGGEQIQIMLASDELPDIVAHGWDTYPGGPQRAISDEYIYELNDIFSEFAPGISKVMQSNPALDKQIKTDEGSYYVFPSILEPGPGQVSYGPVIREDWLKKIGMEAPETIDEWDKMLSAFKDELNVEYPLVNPTNHLLNTFSSAYNVSSTWYRDGDKIKYGPIEPAFKDLLIQLNDWYKRGLIMPDFYTIKHADALKYIMNERSGAVSTWAASGIGVVLDAMEDNKEFDLRGIKFPSSEKGKNPEYGVMSTEVTMGHGVAISKKCKNPELAARFLDYPYTEKGLKTFSYGEEGKTYEVKDGVIDFTDFVYNNPDGWSTSEVVAAYTMNGNIPFIKTSRFAELYYAGSDEMLEAQQTWLQTNVNEHLLPTIYVLEEQADEDGSIMANVRTYQEEMILKFITGDTPIEKFDEYVNQMKEFGIEKSIGFRQEAYNRYLKR